jgi:predicted lipoprotein with Yx(FWY)xxD motif
LTRHWPLARLLAAALALLVGVTFAAPPAQAAGLATGPISTSAAAQVAAMPNAQAAQAAQPATPAPSQKPFIKTGKGALAVVLLAGALGLTFYSFSNDRVKSPAK